MLGLIPEVLLLHLSTSTKVDYYSKVLHGKKVFYLLLYSILDNENLVSEHWKIPLIIRDLRPFLIWMNPKPLEGVQFLKDCLRLILVISKKFLNVCITVFLKVTVSLKETSITLIRVVSIIVSEATAKIKDGIDQKNGKSS